MAPRPRRRSIRSGRLCWALGALTTCAGPVAAKKAPVALEAGYKSRLTQLANASLEAATEHLRWRLGLGSSGVFGGYELEVARGEEEEEEAPATKETPGVWRHGCTEVDGERDTVENCALRQLQALTATCDAGGQAGHSSEARSLIRSHLKALARKEVPTLALQKRRFNGVDIWAYRRRPDGPADDVDASPALQVSALMATVRCGASLGERDHLDEAESWFAGLEKVYPEQMWNTSRVSFHKSGMIWEALALVATHLPKDSSFHASLLKYITAMENFLFEQWQESPSAWSFASARALVIRWRSSALKGKRRRSLMRRWAREHVDRFLGEGGDLSEGILAKIGGGGGYTCGPLQGLAALTDLLKDPELLQVVLRLFEKDVTKYQLAASNAGPWQRLEARAASELVGGFFRDDKQLEMERRQSLRVDDTAQCAIAATQVLRALEHFQGVEVGTESEGVGESVSNTDAHEAEL